MPVIMQNLVGYAEMTCHKKYLLPISLEWILTCIDVSLLDVDILRTVSLILYMLILVCYINAGINICSHLV